MSVPLRGGRADAWLRASLLVGAALTYLVGVDRSGWGNTFYAAAAQAGSQSWTAFFFGSSDAANSITVDKPPAALWVMGLSARLFGLSSWSLLVPQALMGVAAVALLMAAVRRVMGPRPALLAGLLFAVTPVAALLFRYDNPDALLTLLLVAAAWATVRAVEDGRVRWTVLAGALLGFAFLTKSLQAFLVLPGLAGVVLVAGPGPVRRRVGQLLAGGAALAVTAGWWLVAVALIPKADRPWVGGSTDDSPLGLALGYNGLGRLAGETSPSGRQLVSGGSFLRLLGSAATQAGWLLPAAVLGLVAGLLVLRGRPRTDPVRAQLVLWGGWAAATAVVLSVMQGIWHSYYTVELAPALAALTAAGATLLWRRGTRRALLVLVAGSLVTTAWAVSLVDRYLPVANAVPVAILLAGLAGPGLLAMSASRRGAAVPLRRAAAALLVTAALLGPAAWTLATVVRPHAGSAVAAGPRRGGDLLASGHAGRATTASSQALGLIGRDTDDWTWAAAAVGNRASGLQLTVGAPVMPVGGFAGHDQSPTLRAFESDVADHRVHWFVAGPRGSGTAARITAWVRAHAPVVHAGGTTLFDVGALSRVHPPDLDDRP